MLRPGTTRDVLAPSAGPSAEFPPGFRWGVATASYQIEGAADEDGRGETIWDRFSRQPQNIRDGRPGDRATDQYHRLDGDIRLLRELGVDTYRFSVAWSRIQPTGAGATNEAGVDYYSRLVDGLLAAGITPWLTLYHWDLPQALQDRGGWAARDTAYRFADYTDVVFDRLRDRVRHWTTLNEPWVISHVGHMAGVLAPGIKDRQTTVQVAHHLLLGHGEAVARMRSADPSAQLGITLSVQPVYSASTGAEDEAAALKVDLEANRMFLSPLLDGRYPDDFRETIGGVTDLSFIRDDDERTIGQPLDFLGLNYYHGNVVRAAVPSDGALEAADAFDESAAFVACDDTRMVSRGLPRTAMGWEIDPQGLYDILWEVAHTYPTCPPLYVTENGIALDEQPGRDGVVHDPDRIDYLRTHIEVARQAIAEGIDLRGYYVWTFIDCYEWRDGYSRRFGLHHLDVDTMERTPKDSARWFAETIRQTRAEAPGERQEA